REKTFQALALTVLFLVLYLCLAQAIPIVGAAIPGMGGSADGSFLNEARQWLHPFFALRAVLAPAVDNSTALAPAYGFTGVMLLFSVLLSAWSILRLRVWNPSGEP